MSEDDYLQLKSLFKLIYEEASKREAEIKRELRKLDKAHEYFNEVSEELELGEVLYITP